MDGLLVFIGSANGDMEVSAFKTMEKMGHRNKSVMGLECDARRESAQDSYATQYSSKSQLCLAMGLNLTPN